MKNIKLFSRYDLLILIAISLISIILLIPHLFGQDNLIATITVDGEVVEIVELNKVAGFREIRLESDPQVSVKIENGRICVSEADCEDKLCVNCGWLDSDGDMAVCLPGKVVVKVDSQKQSSDSPDVITY